MWSCSLCSSHVNPKCYWSLLRTTNEFPLLFHFFMMTEFLLSLKNRVDLLVLFCKAVLTD